MATHSSTLAWKIPWMEEPGRLQSMELLRVGQTEQLYFHFSVSCIGERNGKPLQCSCLETLGTGEPHRLPSMGSHRVRHNCSDLAVAAAEYSLFTLSQYIYKQGSIQLSKSCGLDVNYMVIFAHSILCHVTLVILKRACRTLRFISDQPHIAENFIMYVCYLI